MHACVLVDFVAMKGRGHEPDAGSTKKDSFSEAS